jgi:hypothetical protein
VASQQTSDKMSSHNQSVCTHYCRKTIYLIIHKRLSVLDSRLEGTLVRACPELLIFHYLGKVRNFLGWWWWFIKDCHSLPFISIVRSMHCNSFTCRCATSPCCFFGWRSFRSLFVDLLLEKILLVCCLYCSNLFLICHLCFL